MQVATPDVIYKNKVGGVSHGVVGMVPPMCVQSSILVPAPVCVCVCVSEHRWPDQYTSLPTGLGCMRRAVSRNRSGHVWGGEVLASVEE